MPIITPPPSDPLVAWSIGALTVIVAVAWARIWSAGSAGRWAMLLGTILAVMGLSAAAALSGLLQRFDLMPPPMGLLIGAVLALMAAFGLSRVGDAAAASVPLVLLIGLQAFRFPLELLMHRGMTRGIVPEALSYGGLNYDILTGLGALALVAAFSARASVPRWALWAWNLWGAWCLLVIISVAVASSPMLRLFGDDPRHVNTWALFFPYVWVPAVLVTNAGATHIAVTRALLRGRRA